MLAIIALLLAVVVHDYVGRTKQELVAKRYLRSIPKDPFTQSSVSWVAVPPADPKKGSVFDIQSSAKGYERW